MLYILASAKRHSPILLVNRKWGCSGINTALKNSEKQNGVLGYHLLPSFVRHSKMGYNIGYTKLKKFVNTKWLFRV